VINGWLIGTMRVHDDADAIDTYWQILNTCSERQLTPYLVEKIQFPPVWKFLGNR